MMPGIKTPTFPGHYCTISYVPEDLPMFQKADNRWTNFKRYVTRLRMASPKHPRGHRLMDSYHTYISEHRKQLMNPKVIHPFSDFRLVWQGIMVIVFYAQFTVIPMNISLLAFNEHITLSAYDLYNRIVLDVICLVDMALRFYVGYVDDDKQEVVLKPQKIVWKYVFSYFGFDLISSFSGFTFLINPQNPWPRKIVYFGLFKGVRVFTFVTYCKYIGKYFKVGFMKHGITILISIYLLFVNGVTCLNIYLIRSQETSDKYLWRMEEQYADYMMNYCSSLYKTLKMMNYLDNGFQNLDKINRMYSIVVWIVCKLVFIWLIAYIMKFAITRRASNVMYLQLLAELKQYMSHKQLPEHLQRRLLTYYEFRYQKSFFKESSILNTITTYLKQEIDTHNCMKLVENLTFFEGMPSSLLTKIVSCLRPQIYLVNDVIFKFGSIGRSMFIIATGTVAIYGQRGSEVCHLTDGQYFGEVGFLERGTRSASVVAVEVCEVYELYLTDFKAAVKPYPHIYNRLVSVADRRKEAMRLIQMRNLTDINATIRVN